MEGLLRVDAELTGLRGDFPDHDGTGVIPDEAIAADDHIQETRSPSRMIRSGTPMPWTTSSFREMQM